MQYLKEKSWAYHWAYHLLIPYPLSKRTWSWRKKEQPNAIFEGDKLSASLSVSLADPQSAKQTDVILINEWKQWTAKYNIWRRKAERISERIAKRITCRSPIHKANERDPDERKKEMDSQMQYLKEISWAYHLAYHLLIPNPLKKRMWS